VQVRLNNGDGKKRGKKLASAMLRACQPVARAKHVADPEANVVRPGEHRRERSLSDRGMKLQIYSFG
jgi:hypothetical protein